jgi:nitroreductase
VGGTGTGSPLERVRPLIRVRQVRDFTDEPVDAADLEAISEVARWSGSSRNEQPWRFIVIRDAGTLRRIAEAGLPQTRSLRTATAAIAIVLPDRPEREVSHAYDDGRTGERMLIAASLLGLGAGIAWIRADVRDALREILALPEDRLVRTVLALGHPPEAARRPKSPPGQARLPRRELVFEERWPRR